MLSQKMIDKYKELHLKKYNIVLSDEQATEQAIMFFNLMAILICTPETRKKLGLP